MAKTIYDNSQRYFAATGQVKYKNAYRRRLQDVTIMGDILNANPENVKSFLGSGKGTQVELYIPGTVKIRETTIDGGITYQQMTDTIERFGVSHMAYWALKFRPEDLSFMPWDPRSEYFTNAAYQMARFIERKFGDDAPGKVPSYNRGHAAGIKYGAYDLGDVTDGHAVVLYKTQKQVDDATGVLRRETAPDFMMRLADTLREGEGQSGMHVSIIVPGPVKHLLKTSELKYEGLMGRNTLLGSDTRGGRNEVRFLGTTTDGVTLIEDNIMFRAKPYTANGKVHTVYPVYALMQDAFAYVDDTVFRDNEMKDIGNWDVHYRAKQIFDWPMLFPSMSAIGYVEIGTNDYDEPSAT